MHILYKKKNNAISMEKISLVWKGTLARVNVHWNIGKYTWVYSYKYINKHNLHARFPYLNLKNFSHCNKVNSKFLCLATVSRTTWKQHATKNSCISYLSYLTVIKNRFMYWWSKNHLFKNMINIKTFQKMKKYQKNFSTWVKLRIKKLSLKVELLKKMSLFYFC